MPTASKESVRGGRPIGGPLTGDGKGASSGGPASGSMVSCGSPRELPQLIYESPTAAGPALLVAT